MAIALDNAKPAVTSGPVQGSRTPAERIVLIVVMLVLIAVALLMFVPFVFSLATSLKTPPEAAKLTFSNMFFPKNPTLDGYRTAFDSNIGRWFFNSAFVATCWIGVE